LHNYVASLNLRWGGIRRLAFVATEADQVHASQRPHLKLLLQDMLDDLVRPYVEGSMRLDVGYFVCAAVHSTRSTPDGRLQGRLHAGGETEVYTPSEVPTSWPKTEWTTEGL